MSVHWVKLILTRSAIREAQGDGVVKSLALRAWGPVGLLHTQNPGIKSEKPLKAEVNVGSRTVVVSL